MKNILVFIDGTGNDPKDAEQKKYYFIKDESASISNVLKLHLMSGGTLDNSSSYFESEGQVCLYYPGVGTSGLFLTKAIEAGLALSEPQKILQQAIQDLVNLYAPGDQVLIFGFSRGAAIARMLAAKLSNWVEFGNPNKFSQPPDISLLGVWDTVVAIGLPQRDQRVRSPEEVDETPFIQSNIKKVVHLVSLDDPREVFTPTLFNKDPRVLEVWFAGVHSDIGGGYSQDGLSDITLLYMQEQIQEANDELRFLKPVQIDMQWIIGNLRSKNAAEIGIDDLSLDPNLEAVVHDQEFRQSRSKEILGVIAERKVRQLRNNAYTDDSVLVHPSVITRIQSSELSYRPASLAADSGAKFSSINDPSIVYSGYEEVLSTS